MSVLVTGGAGYIGGHMVLALLDAGEKVVVLDNLSTGFRWAVPPEAVFVEGDFGDAALVAKIIADHEVDAVAHFAAKIVVPESVTDPLGYYLNNTAKARALIEAVVTAGVKHFIFSSTAAVYGEPDVSPVVEDIQLAPINPYGRSKLMVEWMLGDTAKAHDLKAVVLRYFNVAGADPQGRLGQSGPNATHLIKIAVQAALGHRKGMDVFGTDYPTPRWLLRARLHPGVGSRRGACAGPEPPARWRREPHLQLRLWPRPVRARDRRRGKTRIRGRFPGAHRRPQGRGSRLARRGRRQGADRAGLGAALCPTTCRRSSSRLWIGSGASTIAATPEPRPEPMVGPGIQLGIRGDATMPRFFFDIDDDDLTHRDEEGLELPDLDRAKAEAMATLPAMAREAPSGREHWSVRSRVRNEIGQVVFEATLSMESRQLI